MFVKILNKMKNSLLVVLLILPLFLSAKSFKGTVYYKNNPKGVEVEINFPLNVMSKKLKVKVNGQNQTIEADKLSNLVLHLNEGETDITFKRGTVSRYNPDGSVRKSELRNVWSMISDSRENIVASSAGVEYNVKKRKGKENIVVVYDPWTQGYYLSKPDSDILVTIEPMLGEKFENKVGNAKHILFPECENVMELYAEAIKNAKKRDRVKVIMDTYENCLNAN